MELEDLVEGYTYKINIPKYVSVMGIPWEPQLAGGVFIYTSTMVIAGLHLDRLLYKGWEVDPAWLTVLEDCESQLPKVSSDTPMPEVKEAKNTSRVKGWV